MALREHSVLGESKDRVTYTFPTMKTSFDKEYLILELSSREEIKYTAAERGFIPRSQPLRTKSGHCYRPCFPTSPTTKGPSGITAIRGCFGKSFSTSF
jgi:hypothetical protein